MTVGAVVVELLVVVEVGGGFFVVLVVEGDVVVLVVVDEVDAVVELVDVDEVEVLVVVGFISESSGLTNLPVSLSFTAAVMNFCQMRVGNVPPVTSMPWTWSIFCFVSAA